MKDIVQLEINNMSNKAKKQYYKDLKEKLDFYNGWRSMDTDFLGEDDDRDSYDLRDNHSIEELLEAGFKRYPHEFTDFQKEYKDSVYNQTIKKHGFKDLGYKDIVSDLSQEDKDDIIYEMWNNDFWLTDKGFEDAELEATNDKRLKKHYNLPLNEKEKARLNYHSLLLKSNYDKYVQNKYVIRQWFSPTDDYNENNYDAVDGFVKQQFFKNDDELIVHVMEDGRMNHELAVVYDLLDPHYKVNNWIVTNHELELAKKESLEQSQKLEEPKLKM